MIALRLIYQFKQRGVERLAHGPEKQMRRVIMSQIAIQRFQRLAGESAACGDAHDRKRIAVQIGVIPRCHIDRHLQYLPYRGLPRLHLARKRGHAKCGLSVGGIAHISGSDLFHPAALHRLLQFGGHHIGIVATPARPSQTRKARSFQNTCLAQRHANGGEQLH